MDIVKDMYNNLKDRFSSPFFTSFVISWLFANYKLVFTVLFFSHDNLDGNELKDYFTEIEKHYDLWNNFGLPTTLAVIYTFGYPLLKSYIKYRETLVMTDWDKRTIDETKMQYITIDEHINLMSPLEDLRIKYKSLVGNLTETSTENNELKLKIEQLRAEFAALEIERETKLKEHLQIVEENRESEKKSLEQRKKELQTETDLLKQGMEDEKVTYGQFIDEGRKYSKNLIEWKKVTSNQLPTLLMAVAGMLYQHSDELFEITKLSVKELEEYLKESKALLDTINSTESFPRTVPS